MSDPEEKPKRRRRRKKAEVTDSANLTRSEFERIYSAVISESLEAQIEQLADFLFPKKTVVEDDLGMSLFDLRDEYDPQEEPESKIISRTGIPWLRASKDIDTIVLHQTGVHFGVSDRALAKAEGDRNLALARRTKKIAAHMVVFQNGVMAIPRPLRTYVLHAQRFNSRSLGVEIEGVYPGLLDDPETTKREDLTTLWRGEPDSFSGMVLAAAKQGLVTLVEEAAKENIVIKNVSAHRLVSDQRRSDPGQEIWQKLAVEFAQNELGLRLIRFSPGKTGRPIPLEWDSEGRGEY